MGVSESVTPVTAFVWSLGAFSLGWTSYTVLYPTTDVIGAVVAGGVSFTQGTKALEAEGVDPRSRTRLLPTAFKAFAVGTTIVMTFTAVGWYAALHYEEQHHPGRDVTSSLKMEMKKLFEEKVDYIKGSVNKRT